MNTEIKKKILEICQTTEFYKNPCFYLYDLSKIQQQLENLESNLPNNTSLYYAMKANPHKDILNFLKNFKFIKGVEIASIGELERSLCLFKPKEILFTGPGKTPYELEQSIKKRIKHINLESYVEATRIHNIVKNTNIKPVDILLRININRVYSDAHTLMSGISSKLGVDESLAFDELDKISKLSGLNLKGIHVFAGSGILDYKEILKNFDYIFNFSKDLEASGFNISSIDLGGGFGIDYTHSNKKLDMALLGEGLDNLIKKYNYGDKELILELGRYIVGESGYYVTQIVDIKESHGSKYIITSGGINHQRRPCAVETNHPIEIISSHIPHLVHSQPSIDNELVNIGGPLCLNDDILAKEIYIPHAEIGDLVVVMCSGAYGLSMAATNFLSHPIASEYIHNNLYKQCNLIK
jgi:diaminopimelate decarboxylase